MNKCITIFAENSRFSQTFCQKGCNAEIPVPSCSQWGSKSCWCLGKQKWRKCTDWAVTARVLLRRAAEHQVRASARSDSCSCYNCLANNNYLQMSADEGLANGEAGGLCWLRRDYLGEMTSREGLPKITETFPLLLRQLLQSLGQPCPWRCSCRCRGQAPIAPLSLCLPGLLPLPFFSLKSWGLTLGSRQHACS